MMSSLEDRLSQEHPNRVARIGRVAAHWAAHTPTQPALVEAAGTWTYAELEAAILAARDWLALLGLRGGDRLMLVCENSRAVVALILAATDLDAWPVIVSARLSEPEVDAIRAHSGARRVLYTVANSVQARGHAARHGAATQTVAPLGPVGVGTLAEDAIAEPVEADPARQVAALIYTSGTTGQPKGVMLTHANLLFMARVSGAVRSLGPQDRMFGVLPMSHIVGLSVLVLGTLLYGGALHLVARFDPAAVLKTLARDRLTIMLGVPAMYALLTEYARQQGVTRLDCPDLRIISVSGAPLDRAVKTATEALLGLPLHHGYGITECAPTISQTRVEAPRSDLSVGPLLPGVEARLLGTDGAALGEGEVGELHIRGPNVMKGYYRAPEETASVLDADGWFNTRDLARFEGPNLFIAGRTKELIIRFGFNVYPAEVEAVLNAHPDITQSAVIGLPIEGNEEIIAFVQPERGSVVAVSDIAAHAAAHLAPYKRPSEIIVMDQLPASSTGKILKAGLPGLVKAMRTGPPPT